MGRDACEALPEVDAATCPDGALHRMAAGGRRLLGDFTAVDVALYLIVGGIPIGVNLLTGGVASLALSATAACINVAAVTLVLFLLRGRRRRLRVRRECMRRCTCLLDRIEYLLGTIPRRTEAETLAAFHEMRNCYAETLDLIERMGEGGSMLAIKMRRARDQIVEMYGIQTESLRRTEANAADFADAMRRLGREAGGTARGA